MTKIMDKRWINRTNEQEEIELLDTLINELGISPMVAQVVVNRGIENLDNSRKFLFPSLEHLHDPYLLSDMDKAVKRVIKAIQDKEKVTIYGDYDVDGVTSTVLLVKYLKENNVDVDFYIPHREEGYGINKKALKTIKDNDSDLVISVDCGITSFEETDYANEIGLDLIITDHHEAEEELPDAIAVINPKRKDDQYPYDSLAGVGVAYKLCVALQDELKNPKFSENLSEMLDIVAFGTVADIMPLTGENRVIVKLGLEILNDKKNNRRGFKELIEVSGLNERKITAGHIGFQLAPRINALGRLGDVKPAVEMFLTDNKKALDIAKTLDKKNQERQDVQEGIFQEALSKLPPPTDYEDYSIVLEDDNWHTGIKGIVASNILEEYYRPVILFTINGDLAEGSGRSIEDFNIKEALDECSDILVKYGGHHSAAGMTVKTKDLDKFKKKFEKVTRKRLTEKDLIPKVRYDSVVEINDITFDTVEQLSFLEPFGQSNASPTFMLDNVVPLEVKAVGKDQKHLKLKVQQHGHIIDVIAFSLGHLSDELQKEGVYIDLIGSLDINEFAGRSTLQIQLRDIRIHKKERDPEYKQLDEIYETAEETLNSSNIGDIDYFYTKIVGVSFEGRQGLIKQLKIDDRLKLERQPENVHDKNAIAVVTKEGLQLGYLKAKLSRDLSKHIDKGNKYNVTVTEITGLKDDGNNLGVNIIVENMNKDEHIEEEVVVDKTNFKNLDNQELFEKIKKQILGKYDFRPKQLESILHILNGENTAVVMGTGRGKSAIFQTVASYKALAEDKITIIVYPLRALVNDQLEGMKNKLSPLGIKINKASGDMSKNDKDKMWSSLKDGDIDIILTTPEFLAYYQDSFAEVKDKIDFVVIDEGHHIGNSTMSYRPAYKELTKIREKLGNPLFSVMTATCSDETFESIQSVIPIEKLIIDPTVRNNLTIIDKRELRNKDNYLTDVVSRGDKTIIYVNSREKTVEIAKKLRRQLTFMRDKIGFYHAGLDNRNRYYIEKLFRDGKITTIVSTSAFGEGIDIPDIRHVIHYHMTFNEVEFNQESGRAGRDGKKAYIHLLFGSVDEKINDFIMKKETPSKNLLRLLYMYLNKTSNKGEYEVLLDLDDVAQQLLSNIRDETVVNETIYHSLNIFRELGFVEFTDSADIYYVKFNPSKDKVDLNTSIRYQEATQELEEYFEFVKWVLNADSLELLRSLNRPIFPKEIIAEEG